MTLRLVQAPSPNFNERLHPIDMLVLHYTGMHSGPAALDRLRDPACEVSAHYMVEEDGTVFALVPEDKRAWQAGRSSWQGDEDLNSRSIGIEIVNGGHDHGLPPFPQQQIAAVIELCQCILARWPIPPNRVVAHSDIAPGRKMDPGERFPWRRLADAGVGLWPYAIAGEPGAGEPGGVRVGSALDEAGDRVVRLQACLARIGYRIEITGLMDASTVDVVSAFQRRWRPEAVTGHPDQATLLLAEAVAQLADPQAV